MTDTPGPKTADGVDFTPSMPFWTLEGDRCRRDTAVVPPGHGDSLWIDFETDGRGGRGAVLSLLYSSEEAARAARESPRNSCFCCGRLLRLFCPPSRGKGFGAIDDGLYFRATGNFGSVILDSPDDEFIEVVICDACVAGKVDRLRYWHESGATEHGIREAYEGYRRHSSREATP